MYLVARPTDADGMAGCACGTSCVPVEENECGARADVPGTNGVAVLLMAPVPLAPPLGTKAAAPAEGGSGGGT